ncbi:hypothetical protein JG688_00009320 [Phytophthora aleatoria]|uniref:Uncharacterized protein n=1 Tax=Phytophthora aleatoria TaxID=2496075 RepID=A0A8J5M433_9STRA|nr:hypothetical protein JG688_00009320 [Phytophthora aleatoria]
MRYPRLSRSTSRFTTPSSFRTLALSLRDVYEATHRIELVAQQLEEEHRRGDPRCLIFNSGVGKLSALHHAVTLLHGDAGSSKAKQRSTTSNVRVHSAGNLGDSNYKCESQGRLQVRALAGVRIQPAPEDAVPAPKHTPQQLSPTSLQYVLEVRKLMYLTEFLVLIYYVGVFIPLIFSIYMVVMYHLPNRIYYAQLASLSKDELYDALTNVMFNCSLKLVALILLCSLLKYKLRLSAIHQLAFVLEKQWISVQTKAICWVYYNVQCFLQHQGYDYNFRFTWLKGR